MPFFLPVDKCHKYWPEVGSTVAFGPITVENLKEGAIEALDGFMMRKLKVPMRFTMPEYCPKLDIFNR